LGWKPAYDLERTVDKFVEEMTSNPQRYVQAKGALGMTDAVG